MNDRKRIDNSTQGNIIKIPCSKCSNNTSHQVLLSVDETCDNPGYSWSESFQIIECKGCDTLSFRNTSSNSDDMEYIGDGDVDYIKYESIYPSRIAGRNIISETYYIPTEVRRIYQETIKALNNECPVLAGIGLRALIESVCKEKNANGNNLYEKIDDLVANNILTPTGSVILHKIRNLGNASAHEVRPHSPEQLFLAMDVIQHLLQDVYILPAKVAIEFKDKNS